MMVEFVSPLKTEFASNIVYIVSMQCSSKGISWISYFVKDSTCLINLLQGRHEMESFVPNGPERFSVYHVKISEFELDIIVNPVLALFVMFVRCCSSNQDKDLQFRSL